jgi:hypothetical protein
MLAQCSTGGVPVVNTKTAICSGNCGLGADGSRNSSRDSTEEGGVELNPVTFHCLPGVFRYRS